MPDDHRLHLSREELADILVTFHRHERREFWSRVFHWVALSVALGILAFVVWRHV